MAENKQILGSISLYDINKKAYQASNPLDPICINRICTDIVKSMESKGCFWLLLCRERMDFTIFEVTANASYRTGELLDTLKNRGYIMDIYASNEDSSEYEIWIQDFDSTEVVMYKFFACEDWVVKL